MIEGPVLEHQHDKMVEQQFGHGIPRLQLKSRQRRAHLYQCAAV
jgi:hypothetical protein